VDDGKCCQYQFSIPMKHGEELWVGVSRVNGTRLALRPRYLVVCDLHRTPLVPRGYAESANAQPRADFTMLSKYQFRIAARGVRCGLIFTFIASPKGDCVLTVHRSCQSSPNLPRCKFANFAPIIIDAKMI
jgi:hypothetical protein